MRATRSAILLGGLLFLSFRGDVRASEPLATAQLQIQGNRLTIYADAQTTDAEQTVNVGESARIRTCYGDSSAPCGSVLAGDPRIAGLRVLAELAGPELPQAVSLQTLAGGTFVVPGFQQEGDYRVENIRLINETTGQVIGAAEPSAAVLHVRRILLASATVTRLTLADLQARGITISQDNFQAFNFAVGFAIGTSTVTIDFPVLYTGNGTCEGLTKPTVNLDGLTPEARKAVERWQPPQIVPFRLEVPSKDLLEEQDQENQILQFPLFGAIVMPGNVSYLNQFFDARLIVANGAPSGSGANIETALGALRLPSGNVLRVAQTEPPVAPGQQVPVVRDNGARVLLPGEQGSAVWTVEGLVAGTHVLQMDISADLVRPGRKTIGLTGRTQAAIEVVDARFNLTFSHPDVVREGEAYNLFVTVTNLSRAPQHLITVTLDGEHITGAHKPDSSDDFKRTIDALDPGQAETLEFPLVADVTGKVVATTYQSDSPAGRGTIRLRTGVGELGIPLSPASLVMPRFSERLARPYLSTDEFFKANVRLLGLAYSLAVAPAGMAPAGLPHVIKADVERRAVDIAEAGQRTFLREPLLESLEVLVLDQLGNRDPLEEFDQLRRSLKKGQAASAQLAALLRQEQGAHGLDAVGFFDHFATTTSYTQPYLAAIVVPTGSAPTPVLELRQPTPQGATYLAYTSDESSPLRTVMFGEIYGVKETPSGSGTVPFAVIGHVGTADVYQLNLHNETNAATEGRLLVLVPDGATGAFRRLDFGRVVVAPHTVVGVNVGASVPDPAQGGFQLYFPATGQPVPGASSPSPSAVALPQFRLIGAVQDFQLPDNRYGQGLSYLFNRPPDKASAEDASHYRIRSTFNGLDVNGVSVNKVSEQAGKAAFLQPSERVVNVRYAGPISALVAPGGGTLLTHEHLLAAGDIRDRHGSPLDPSVPAPIIEMSPLHVGGLVDGRVLRGTGDGAAGATVQLIRARWVNGLAGGFALDLVAEATTDADGGFYFDFVEEPHTDQMVKSGFTLRATVPPGNDPATQPGAVEEVSSIVRQQSRLAHVNIALLGRGLVKGRLIYAGSRQPVADGTVTVASTLFTEIKSTKVAADGSFAFPGAPVGPLTLTGRDPNGRSAYATVGLNEPGATVDVVLEIQPASPQPGMGTVTGTVLFQPAGTPPPAPLPTAGAQVAVYSNGAVIGQKETNADGRFQFTGVPAGQVSVQAANWQISRTVAFTDLMLAADQIQDVTLTLAESVPHAVTGKVLFREPIGNSLVPVQNAVVFIEGPGVFANSGADGSYRIDGVPSQGATDQSYRVTAIDYARKLQGDAALPRVLSSSPEVIAAQDIVLAEMRGGVDGVVVDPLGRPLAGVSVMLFPYGEVVAGGGGKFAFNDVPVGKITTNGPTRLLGHIGDGLGNPPGQGKVGFIGAASTEVLFGGHRPFVTLQLRGSGVVNIHTKTATSTGILTPIYYRPTWYSAATKRIGPKPEYIETTTDDLGDLQLTLPVGPFEIVAYNPFHGRKTINGTIDYSGQIRSLEILFEDACTVQGTVVDVDGVTPVPGAEVKLLTGSFTPQTQRADAQGGFRFELVPQGHISVTAVAVLGTIERVGRVDSSINLPGQILELTVRLKAQGSIRGRVMEQTASGPQPLADAQFYVSEGGYPNRRLPAGQEWFTTDANGHYEVSQINAGPVWVTARDAYQVARMGSVSDVITADWQILELPDIVISVSVGSISVVVRDPSTGAGVPDCQVTLDNVESTVADANGHATFDALELGTHSVYAFHAPTGRSGRVGGLQLASAGQELAVVVQLEQRGEVNGTLFDDQAKQVPVSGATVALSGQTARGELQALATTGSASAGSGRFSFLGIPEGHFSLEAAVTESPRRARAAVDLTATSPIADVDLVLESVGDVSFRVYERLKTGLHEVNPASLVLSVRLTQEAYDYTEIQPTTLGPGHLYQFPMVLLSRKATVRAVEASGEQRSAQADLGSLEGCGPLAGSGTVADPCQLTLGPKGVLRVWVRDSIGQPVAGSQVTLAAGAQTFPSVSGSDGSVTFSAVPAGRFTATARSSLTGLGGFTEGALTYDDDVIEAQITLVPAVSAHGVVYQAVPNDRYNGDPSSLVPEVGAFVRIQDSLGHLQIVATGQDGTYAFHGLPTGSFKVDASDTTGEAVGGFAGALVGPEGTDNTIPPIVLDASAPKIVSIAPPPGMENVSRTATVEIVFSEPLIAAVLPTGEPQSAFFSLRSASGAAAVGSWTSGLDSNGRQVVRFTPSQPYENSTTYSVTIVCGVAGVRDRVDRPLSQFGNIGSNFKTSDTIGPAVIGTEPSLAKPVDPTEPIRFDFNEIVSASDEMLDGDGVGDAAELTWGQSDGAGGVVWKPLPVTLSLVRGGLSLSVLPIQGVQLSDDTLRRHIVVSRLADGFNNTMTAFEGDFRIYDQNPPLITEIPMPPGAPDGRLAAGTSYALTPSLSNMDDVTSTNPGGDIDRVDYFLTEPTGTTQPSFSSRTHPFPFVFVAAYVGNGVDPRPFPVWARAVDTSANPSNVVQVQMQVLPNVSPVVTSVSVNALAPVAGIFYAGSTVRATVIGPADADDIQLTVSATLWQQGAATPLAGPVSRGVQRPSSGNWADLAAPTFDFVIPVSLPEGSELFVRATVIDPHGASAAAETSHFAVVLDNPPTGSVAVSPVSGILPNHVLTVTITGQDDVGLKQALVSLSGAASESRTIAFPTGTAGQLSGDFRIPETAVGGSVAVAVQLEDTFGQRAQLPQVTIPVLTDTEPPSIVTVSPAQDLAVDEGQNVSFEFQLQDLVSVVSTDLQVNDQPVTVQLSNVQQPGDAWGATAIATWRAPATGQTTTVPYALTATDHAGNQATAQGTLTVRPVVNPNAPLVVISCPANGDGCAPGAALVISFALSDSDQIRDYSVLVNGQTVLANQAVNQTQFSGQYSWTPPTSAQPGDTFAVRIEARDYADNVGFLQIALSVPQGIVLSGSQSLDASQNDQALVLGAGSYTVTAPLSLASLTLLQGAKVLGTTGQPLQLTVANDMRIACGSSVDASGQGYAGGVTYPGAVVPGNNSGGSHLGYGGVGSAPAGSVFGSVYRPQEDGGGGQDINAGKRGGGAVRLVVGGSVVVDGVIRANGAGGDLSNWWRGGAGGSVWVTVVGQVSGGGVIEASGGVSGIGGLGSGGGGAVAVEYGSTAGAVLSNTRAVGGSAGIKGGAGAVYLRGPLSSYGDLIVDNGGIDGQGTELPSLGSGTAQAGSSGAELVTGRATVIAGYFEGHWVEISGADGTLKGTWRIGSIAGDGKTVTLVPNGVEAISVEPGDSWQGVYRFDSLTAKGRAKAIFGDKATVGTVSIESGSSVVWFNDAPLVNGSRVSLAAQSGAFWVAGAAGAVTDSDGIASANLRNLTTAATWPVTVATDGSFPMTAVSGTGGDQIELEATDANQPPKTTKATVGVLPVNAEAPTIVAEDVSISVHDSAFWIAGAPGTASDPNGIASATLRNVSSDPLQVWTVAVLSDGSFDPTSITGKAGDTIEFEVVDGHPQSRTTTAVVGVLAPPNYDPPTVNTAQIHFARYGSGIVHLRGAAGAVGDPDQPITLLATNRRTGAQFGGQAAPEGSFDLIIEASAGDGFDLKATDGHPQPLSVTVDVGALPENQPPVVDAGKVRLMTLGLGYQVVGDAGAVADPEQPLTVVVSNQSTGWSTPSIVVGADGGFYARLEGSQGDTMSLVAGDATQLQGSPVPLGILPGDGVLAWGKDLSGHTVSILRGQFAVMDGGTSVGWLRDFPVQESSVYTGLVLARDVFYNLKLQAPMALDGGNLVGWVEQGSPPVRQALAIPLSTGTLVRAQVRGDETFILAEEAAGLRLLRFTAVVEQGGTWVPNCSGTVGSFDLPQTAGIHALELLPAGDGRLAVLTDDPVAELRVVDASDPLETTGGGTIDLSGSAAPRWGIWQTGELYVGRADGSLEVWRWGDTAPELYTAWVPQQGKATAAARLGDQLWVGLDSGVLQQVTLADPTQPRLVGEFPFEFNEPVVTMWHNANWIAVVTSGHYYDMVIPHMPPTVAPDLVSWGHGGGRSWAGIGFLVDWPNISITWSDGFNLKTSDGRRYYSGVNTAEVADAPTFVASGDGVPAPPYTPPAVRLRSFNSSPDPSYCWGVRQRPVAGCATNRAAVFDVHTSVDILWVATGTAGESGILHSYLDERTGERGETTFLANGPVSELFGYNKYLVACDNGLTVWDTDNARGGDAKNPVMKQQVELFGADPVAVAADVPWGPVVLAANNPARFAMVRQDPWFSDSPTPFVQADNVLLPGIEGSIRDLFSRENKLYVLTDAGVAGRIYRYGIDDPTAPVLENQIGVSPGAPAVAMTYREGDDTTESADSVLVVRRGWGIDVFSADLGYLTSLRLPGDAQDVFWDWSTYVALGNFGVGRIAGPADQPTVDYVLPNMNSVGNVIHRSNDPLVTPEGPTFR